jgi:hypothetical protein
MLSFEILRPDAGEVAHSLEIYFDSEGLESLLAQLRFLEKDRTDHVHLMCDEWGGNHLSDAPVIENSIPIRHVRITKL